MQWTTTLSSLRQNSECGVVNVRTTAISFPELRSPWPAVGKRELWEQPLWKNKGNNRILVIRLTAHLHLWRMPEMVAPRARVFRPLVKGNEALGTRLGRRRIAISYSVSAHDWNRKCASGVPSSWLLSWCLRSLLPTDDGDDDFTLEFRK